MYFTSEKKNTNNCSSNKQTLYICAALMHVSVKYTVCIWQSRVNGAIIRSDSCLFTFALIIERNYLLFVCVYVCNGTCKIHWYKTTKNVCILYAYFIHTSDPIVTPSSLMRELVFFFLDSHSDGCSIRLNK